MELLDKALELTEALDFDSGGVSFREVDGGGGRWTEFRDLRMLDEDDAEVEETGVEREFFIDGIANTLLFHRIYL